MIELISEIHPIAKKSYACMAWEWLENIDDVDWLTFAEKREVVKARKNGYRIKKGERYLKQFVKCCGQVGTFRAIPALHKICLVHAIYEEC